MPSLSRLLPILRWGRTYDRADLRGDVVAGFTVSALLVPQGLAYALLAGLPPQVGLYASIVPVLVYAALGTSRQLALGPVAIVSLMTASALSALYEEGTAEYLAGAATLAILTGLVHLVLRVGRMAFVVNFLSHSVLVGFTAASALIIVASQVKHVLGISIPRTDAVLDTAVEVAKAIDTTHGPTLVLAIASIVAIVLLKRVSKRVPAP